MKKFYALKFVSKILLFAAGLIAALWFFMPWKQVGEAVLLSASSRLPQPAALEYSTVRSAGGGFTVSGLKIRNIRRMVDVSFGAVTFVPDVAASLLSMAPTCRVTFTGAAVGDIAVTPLKKIPGVAPGSGRVTVSLSRQGVFFDDILSDGELAVSGSFLADPSAKRIVWADMSVDVKSQEFENSLAEIVPVLRLPLRQDELGRWIFRRAREGE